jgi:hypothetical protein
LSHFRQNPILSILDKFIINFVFVFCFEPNEKYYNIAAWEEQQEEKEEKRDMFTTDEQKAR